MRPPETFQTERLLMRPPQAADAAEIFASYAQDHEVTNISGEPRDVWAYAIWRD